MVSSIDDRVGLRGELTTEVVSPKASRMLCKDGLYIHSSTDDLGREFGCRVGNL